MQVQGDHYFTASPASANERSTVAVTLAGRTLTLETAPGVFSNDGLDVGTAVLLATVPAPPDGTLADIGCGWGPIALTLALLRPTARVWAIDVNERALDLTLRNAQAVGASYPLAAISAASPTRVPRDLKFDALWSNPPIRIGKPALHAVLQEWLPRLNIDAEAHLVVQKHLGADSLAAWLAEQTDAVGRPWGSVERIATDKGYRVIRLRRE